MSSLSFVGLPLARWLAARFSVETISSLGGYLGRHFGPKTKRHRRALRNLRHALPASSINQRDEIAAEMWDNFGRTVAESLTIDRIVADPTRVVLENPEALAEVKNNKRGTVFVGLHFGNWENTAIPAIRLNLGLIGVYKPSQDVDLNSWLHRHRLPLYPGGLLPGNPQTFLKITRHVRRGGAICLLGDHKDPNGLEIEFFGKTAPSTALPAMLAVRYGARLIAARVDRLKGSRFSVYLKPIITSKTGDQKADIYATTQSLQSVFEKWISVDPGKWLWFYKRWQGHD